MFLNIRTVTERNVTTIMLDGCVTLGEASGDLRDAIKEVLAAGETNILVDLAAVPYIDSAGMGEFIGAFVACGKSGATLKFLHLQRRVRGLMQITRLLTVFETFEDREEALRSFARVPAAAGA
jgi:anti-sigma B factor antagonist